jgi:hypothetical protein
MQTRSAYIRTTRSMAGPFTTFVCLSNTNIQKKRKIWNKNRVRDDNTHTEEDLTTQEDNEYDDDNQSVMTEIEDLMEYETKFPSPKREYVVDINFDEAHDEWVSNKKRMTMMDPWVYVCGKTLKNGKTCKLANIDKTGIYSGCKRHYAWEEKEQKHYIEDENDIRLYGGCT